MTTPIATPGTPAARRKRPILVVDDEPEMLLSLRDLLRREFDVYTAGSGQEGLELLQEHEIHVVMSDQRMPQMTGVELLKRIKCEHPEAIRMIFTGYADIHAVIDAVNQGSVFRYVTKPWDPEELVAALRSAGEAFDRLADRNRLLADLRVYEQRCEAFDAGLRSGQLGTLTAAGAAEVETMARDGRALRDRLDRVLDPKARGLTG
jgi:DNA-binding NtrC family response regulator